MIDHFPNISAINTRKTTPTPTSTDTLVTVSSFQGIIRPVTNKSNLYIENNMGNEFDLFVDDSEDIKVGDDIFVSGIKYDTLGVTEYEDLEAEDSFLSIRINKK